MGLYALPPALSPEEKKQQVQDALEYALDAAILERPSDPIAFVSSKLRVGDARSTFH